MTKPAGDLQITGDELQIESLKRKAVGCSKKSKKLLVDLKKFQPKLTEDAKDLFARAGMSVAAADGKFEKSELDFMLKVAKALEMTQSRFNAILESLNLKSS